MPTDDPRPQEQPVRTARQSYRLALAVALLTALLLAFGIAALGIIGDGGREDHVHLAVFVVLVVGTLVGCGPAAWRSPSWPRP
jgi:hypothetical protein